MPYSTNPAYGRAANNLIGAFMGSAQDDAAIARSRHYQTETQKLQEEMAARDALAALYASGGAPDQGQIASGIIRSGYNNTDMANLSSMLPIVDDAQRARNMVASGRPIGKDDFFSAADRNANAVYDVGVGSRAVRGDGSQVVGAHPSAINALDALVEQRSAAAAKSRAEAAKPGGGKIPKMGATETELALGALMSAFGYDDQNEFFADINSNPAISSGLYGALEQGWSGSGGNTAAAIAEAQGFLNTIPQPKDNDWNPLNWFSEPGRFEGAALPSPAAPAQVAPSTPAGGAQAAPAIRPGTKAVNRATGQTLIFNGQQWVAQ